MEYSLGKERYRTSYFYYILGDRYYWKIKINLMKRGFEEYVDISV